MQKMDVRALYYITHIDNLPYILERGILSHETLEAEGIHPTHICDVDTVG